jgi:FkbM family methyltransferase
MSAVEPPFISYAQNQEDVLLWRVFKGCSDGFYVDVGAAHPEWESVTKAFYDRGWRGINLEPNPHFHTLLETHRPRDINICALAGGEDGERELHIVGKSGLSTATGEYVDLLVENGHVVTDRLVSKMVRLDDVLRKQGVRDIHFLKIDAEGMEKEVLDGCSFSAFRPKVLVIEATLPETNLHRSDGMRDDLASRDYKFVFFDGLNDYFVASECCELAVELDRPVNILDSYRRASEVYLEDRLARLERGDGQMKAHHGTGDTVNPQHGQIGNLKNGDETKTGLVNKSIDRELKEEDVAWAYRHFFKRDPESQKIVHWHLTKSRNLRQLVEVFTGSEEYQYKKYNHVPPLEDQAELHYFFHIHKTGGMSVHEYLQDAVPENKLLPGYHAEDIINNRNLYSYSYLSGHFGRAPMSIKGRRLRMATVLRDPVQRGWSNYRHAQRLTNYDLDKETNGVSNKKIHEEAQLKSLDDFLSDPIGATLFGNVQSFQLAMLSSSPMAMLMQWGVRGINEEKLYDLAMQGLAKMELVGTTEKLEIFISGLADIWSLPKPMKKYKVNSDPNQNPKELTEDQIERIKKLCAVDIRIYEQMSKM